MTAAAVDRLARAEVYLAEVVSIDDAKALRNMAEAARVLARQVRAGTAHINYATSVKVRAELRLADLVDEGQRAGLIAGQRDGRPGVRAANTYTDLGLSRREVSEARLLRAVYTDDDIVRLIADATAGRRELPRIELLNKARLVLRERYCVVGRDPRREGPWGEGAVVFVSSAMPEAKAVALAAQWRADHDGCTARVLPDGRVR